MMTMTTIKDDNQAVRQVTHLDNLQFLLTHNNTMNLQVELYLAQKFITNFSQKLAQILQYASNLNVEFKKSVVTNHLHVELKQKSEPLFRMLHQLHLLLSENSFKLQKNLRDSLINLRKKDILINLLSNNINRISLGNNNSCAGGINNYQSLELKKYNNLIKIKRAQMENLKFQMQRLMLQFNHLLEIHVPTTVIDKGECASYVHPTECFKYCKPDDDDDTSEKYDLASISSNCPCLNKIDLTPNHDGMKTVLDYCFDVITPGVQKGLKNADLIMESWNCSTKTRYEIKIKEICNLFKSSQSTKTESQKYYESKIEYLQTYVNNLELQVNQMTNEQYKFCKDKQIINENTENSRNVIIEGITNELVCYNYLNEVYNIKKTNISWLQNHYLEVKCPKINIIETPLRPEVTEIVPIIQVVKGLPSFNIEKAIDGLKTLTKAELLYLLISELSKFFDVKGKAPSSPILIKDDAQIASIIKVLVQNMPIIKYVLPCGEQQSKTVMIHDILPVINDLNLNEILLSNCLFLKEYVRLIMAPDTDTFRLLLSEVLKIHNDCIRKENYLSITVPLNVAKIITDKPITESALLLTESDEYPMTDYSKVNCKWFEDHENLGKLFFKPRERFPISELPQLLRAHRNCNYQAINIYLKNYVEKLKESRQKLIEEVINKYLPAYVDKYVCNSRNQVDRTSDKLIDIKNFDYNCTTFDDFKAVLQFITKKLSTAPKEDLEYLQNFELKCVSQLIQAQQRREVIKEVVKEVPIHINCDNANHLSVLRSNIMIQVLNELVKVVTSNMINVNCNLLPKLDKLKNVNVPETLEQKLTNIMLMIKQCFSEHATTVIKEITLGQKPDEKLICPEAPKTKVVIKEVPVHDCQKSSSGSNWFGDLFSIGLLDGLFGNKKGDKKQIPTTKIPTNVVKVPVYRYVKVPVYKYVPVAVERPTKATKISVICSNLTGVSAESMSNIELHHCDELTDYSKVLQFFHNTPSSVQQNILKVLLSQKKCAEEHHFNIFQQKLQELQHKCDVLKQETLVHPAVEEEVKTTENIGGLPILRIPETANCNSMPTVVKWVKSTYEHNEFVPVTKYDLIEMLSTLEKCCSCTKSKESSLSGIWPYVVALIWNLSSRNKVSSPELPDLYECVAPTTFVQNIPSADDKFKQQLADIVTKFQQCIVNDWIIRYDKVSDKLNSVTIINENLHHQILNLTNIIQSNNLKCKPDATVGIAIQENVLNPGSMVMEDASFTIPISCEDSPSVLQQKLVNLPTTVFNKPQILKIILTERNCWTIKLKTYETIAAELNHRVQLYSVKIKELLELAHKTHNCSQISDDLVILENERTNLDSKQSPNVQQCLSIKHNLIEMLSLNGENELFQSNFVNLLNKYEQCLRGKFVLVVPELNNNLNVPRPEHCSDSRVIIPEFHDCVAPEEIVKAVIASSMKPEHIQELKMNLLHLLRAQTKCYVVNGAIVGIKEEHQTPISAHPIVQVEEKPYYVPIPIPVPIPQKDDHSQKTQIQRSYQLLRIMYEKSLAKIKIFYQTKLRTELIKKCGTHIERLQYTIKTLQESYQKLQQQRNHSQIFGTTSCTLPKIPQTDSCLTSGDYVNTIELARYGNNEEFKEGLFKLLEIARRCNTRQLIGLFKENATQLNVLIEHFDKGALIPSIGLSQNKVLITNLALAYKREKYVNTLLGAKILCLKKKLSRCTCRCSSRKIVQQTVPHNCQLTNILINKLEMLVKTVLSVLASKNNANMQAITTQTNHPLQTGSLKANSLQIYLSKLMSIIQSQYNLILSIQSNLLQLQSDVVPGGRLNELISVVGNQSRHIYNLENKLNYFLALNSKKCAREVESERSRNLNLQQILQKLTDSKCTHTQTDRETHIEAMHAAPQKFTQSHPSSPFYNLFSQQSQINNNNVVTTNAHQQLLEEKKSFESQVEFLNSIIADMKRKNDEQQARIEILESGYSPAAADDLQL